MVRIIENICSWLAGDCDIHMKFLHSFIGQKNKLTADVHFKNESFSLQNNSEEGYS